VESAKKVPCAVIRYKQGGFLASLLAERGLGFNISQPENPIHRNNGKFQNFAYVSGKPEAGRLQATMKAEYTKGETVSALARKYEVCRATVLCIVK
jgi:hypothetical protein